MVSLHIGFFALLLSSPEENNNLVLQFQERPLNLLRKSSIACKTSKQTASQRKISLVALGSTPRQTEFQLAAEMSSDTCKMLLIQLPFLFFENLGGKFVSPFD